MRGKVKVFVSCAAKDEEHKAALLKHLRALGDRVELWNARMITAGNHREETIEARLRWAELVLLLVSSDYLADAQTHQEMAHAIAQQKQVVPVFVRPVDLKGTVIEGMEMLPHGMMPVTLWPSPDEAWLSVATGIRGIVEKRLGVAPASTGPVYSGGASAPTPRAPAQPTRASAPSAPAYAANVRVQTLVPTVQSVTAPVSTEPARSGGRSRTGVWLAAVLGVAGMAAVTGAIAHELTQPRPPAAQPGDLPPNGGARPPAAAPCCGGAQCARAAQDVRGSLCDTVRGNCGTCPSKRAYVADACSAHLERRRAFRLRGASVVGEDADEVCVRRADEPAAADRCAPVAGGVIRWSQLRHRAGYGDLVVRTADLLRGGVGLHVDLRRGGSLVASRDAAAVGDVNLNTSALCLGLMLHVDQAQVTFYLDD